MFKKTSETEQRLVNLIDKLEEHEKQHTREHWIVIALLATTIALHVVAYVS